MTEGSGTAGRSARIAPALLAVAGGLIFVAGMFAPYQTQAGPPPRDVAVLDVDQGLRVWGPPALAPLGVLAVALAGAVVLGGGRWTTRRAGGLFAGAGMWATLRGASLLGVSLYPGGSLGPEVDPAPGASLALGGGALLLAAGVAVFARAPDVTGARSRLVAAIIILGAVGYAVAHVIPAARQDPPLPPRDLTLVNLSASTATLVWETLLPAIATIVLLLAGMRILTGTAGGTGAILMALGAVTALQFGGLVASASRGEFPLSPAPGAFLGLATGGAILLAGLLAPAGPAEPGPQPASVQLGPTTD